MTINIARCNCVARSLGIFLVLFAVDVVCLLNALEEVCYFFGSVCYFDFVLNFVFEGSERLVVLDEIACACLGLVALVLVLNANLFNFTAHPGQFFKDFGRHAHQTNSMWNKRNVFGFGVKKTTHIYRMESPLRHIMSILFTDHTRNRTRASSTDATPVPKWQSLVMHITPSAPDSDYLILSSLAAFNGLGVSATDIGPRAADEWVRVFVDDCEWHAHAVSRNGEAWDIVFGDKRQPASLMYKSMSGNHVISVCDDDDDGEGSVHSEGDPLVTRVKMQLLDARRGAWTTCVDEQIELSTPSAISILENKIGHSFQLPSMPIHNDAGTTVLFTIHLVPSNAE